MLSSFPFLITLLPSTAWLRSKTEILGYIPQVPHTFALIEGTYPFMNEHQVGMGESSCAAKLWTTPRNVGNGTALFNIGELMTVAMERSTTAREAIQVSPSLPPA
jgi:dipeptidase